MEYEEFTGKTVEDAITEACQKFTVTSDRLDYEVVEKGSSGFLGIGTKAAVIKARALGENEEKPVREEKAEVTEKEVKKTESEKAKPGKENKGKLPK